MGHRFAGHTPANEERRTRVGGAARADGAVARCRLAPICMGVLYHISTDDKHKSLFTYTRAVGLIYERLVSIADLRREPELIALAVNLTQNHRNAAALCEGPRFDKLMQHAIDGQSDLLFKVMRNCSQVRSLWRRCA